MRKEKGLEGHQRSIRMADRMKDPHRSQKMVTKMKANNSHFFPISWLMPSDDGREFLWSSVSYGPLVRYIEFVTGRGGAGRGGFSLARPSPYNGPGGLFWG